MSIFLLVVKVITRKQTQKQTKGSQIGTGSTSSGGLMITSYCRFKPDGKIHIFATTQRDGLYQKKKKNCLSALFSSKYISLFVNIFLH